MEEENTRCGGSGSEILAAEAAAAARVLLIYDYMGEGLVCVVRSVRSRDSQSSGHRAAAGASENERTKTKWRFPLCGTGFLRDK